MNKVVSQISFIPLFSLLFLVYTFQNTHFLHIKYGLTLIATLIFSVLFFWDYQRILNNRINSRKVLTTVSATLGFTSGAIFSSLLMSPAYLIEGKSAVLSSVLCAIIFGATGYQSALISASQQSVNFGVFEGIKRAAGGAIIGGTIGACANFMVLFLI